MGTSLSLISHLGHKTQEFAPDIHQASLHVILQSLTFRFCGATTGFFFLDIVQIIDILQCPSDNLSSQTNSDFQW